MNDINEDFPGAVDNPPLTETGGFPRFFSTVLAHNMFP